MSKIVSRLPKLCGLCGCPDLYPYVHAELSLTICRECHADKFHKVAELLVWIDDGRTNPTLLDVLFKGLRATFQPGASGVPSPRDHLALYTGIFAKR